MISKEALVFLAETNGEMRDAHEKYSAFWYYFQGRVEAYETVLEAIVNSH